MLQHTIYAQFNTFSVLMLAVTYLALCRQKYLWAGVLAAGLLFKPQINVAALFMLLWWSALSRQRWRFWLGLILTVLPMWAIPELLEPNWVPRFIGSLSSYPPAMSAVDRLGNPYQMVSLGLVLLTAWFTWRLRHVLASSVPFSALLAFTIGLTALIMPIYGMLNITLMGPVGIILLNGYTVVYPAYGRWIWWGLVGLFVVGLAAFMVPLLILGLNGPHIDAAEAVYRFATPILLSLAALPLMKIMNPQQ
jgi:hypothetical protein